MIPITDRIEADPRTIPLAELLLTTFQIVESTDKDLRDTVALLREHELGDQDTDTINADVVAALTADDWGNWRTVQLNAERVRERLDTIDLDSSDRRLIAQRVDALWSRIEASPKSRRWRLRARVGERKRWYEVPDEA